VTGGESPFLDRPQLSDEAAAYVRSLIMSGQVRGGEYLRVERLAGETGMSATPIREGLLALRGEGFLQLIPRRGFMVVPLGRQDVEDLYLVQANLAGELAARAAVRIGSTGLAELEALQVELEAANSASDTDRTEALNHRFHRMINLTAAAPKLAWFLSRAARYAPRRFYPTIRGWPEASVEDHHAVLRALRAHDAEDARKAMYQHIQHAGALLIAHLRVDQDWS
jgi:DNA-binding GntR family transcriptional regulator